MILLMYYLLLGLFFLLLVLANKRMLLEHFANISKNAIILLILILSFLGVVYWNYAPAVHRVYGDEPNLLSGATKSGLESVSDGAFLVFLYYNLYEYVTPNNVLAIRINTLMSLATLLLLFTLVYLLFQKELIAMSSVMVLGSMGIYIVQSTNAYTMIWSLFFALLSSIAFWIFIRTSAIAYHLLAIVSVMFATMIRLEYFLLIPVYFIFWIALKRGRTKKEHKSLRYWSIPALIWIALLIPFLFFFLLRALRLKIASASFSVSNWVPTLVNHFIPSTGSISVSLFIIFLALMIYRIKENQVKESLFLLAIAVSFLSFYLFNVYYSPQFRIVLAAYTAFVWGVPIELLRANVQKKWRFVIWTVLIALFLVAVGFKVMSINAWTSNKVPFHYLSTYSPNIVHSHANTSCVFITSYASNLQMSHRLHAISANEIVRDSKLLGKYPCWYFFEDYLCAIPKEEKGMQQDCRHISSAFNLSAALVITDSKLNYTLYRLAGKEQQKLSPTEPLIEYVNTSTKTRILENMYRSLFKGEHNDRLIGPLYKRLLHLDKCFRNYSSFNKTGCQKP